MHHSNLIFEAFLKSRSVCTDTRSLKIGDVFFALKGPSFNGNLFAKSALDHGASLTVIDEPQNNLPNGKFVLVDDVLSALQQLARDYRKTLTGTVIGLTGSNGKTTCKELFRDVLGSTYKTHATKGNLNNHIGVPLTLLSAPDDAEMIIIEMGANHQKEIELLSSIARPEFGYITNFGKAHLEGFGGMEGVIKGKSELYAFLRDSGGTVLYNALDALQKEKSQGIKRFSFGPHGDIVITDHETDLASVEVDGTVIQSQLTGSFHFTNIAAAVALGLNFDVPIEDIKSAIENYRPQMNRTEWRKTERNELLLDAYNANPDSMNAAIRSFAKLDKPNKWFILGDMFELGESSAEEHQNTVNVLNECLAENVILVGSIFNATNHDFSSFETTKEARAFLMEQNISSCTILLKGSRGMKLETLIDLL